jgi:hypothetical protein
MAKGLDEITSLEKMAKYNIYVTEIFRINVT